MSRRRLSVLGILTAAVLILAAVIIYVRSTSLALPVVPIDRIVQVDLDRMPTITDPRQIARVIDFVQARKYGWHSTFVTPPTPQYSMAFYSGASFQYAIWISMPEASWIGFGDRTNSTQLFRDVTPAERDELLRLLDIPAISPKSPPTSRPAATSPKQE